MMRFQLGHVLQTWVLTLFFLACLTNFCLGADHEKPNVLLILVDDLKPALGCYGDAAARSPNIDSLADMGLRFDLAYCNQAVCAASRFTLMLGSHPTSTGLYSLGNNLRKSIPNAVTLPQHFARHGYRTESLGKVFHIGHGNQGDPASFSVPHFHEKVIEYLDPQSTDGGKLTREEAYFSNRKLGQIRSLPRGAAFESPDVLDHQYADGRVANEAIRRLQKARKRRDSNGTPFFMAVGFARPHLPFSAPKKYWKMHDPDKLPMPKFLQTPKDASPIGFKRGGEISNYKPVTEQGYVDKKLTRKLIHGYYASVSYVDAQIGRVISALKELDLAKNTIIVLWGDHGFHLGDHQFWTKHTNYEQATRIPILLVAPGITRPGSATRQLVESVDLFPTLTDVCGIPQPKGPQPIDGVSLMPVLKAPNARVRNHAYHVYPRGKLGRAVRTDRHRLVEWRKPGEPMENAEYELFDYLDDPQETRNHAEDHPDTVRILSRILHQYKVLGGNDNPAKSPRIAKSELLITAEVQAKKPHGVVVAQGGREQGIAIHFNNGKAAFDVRVNGKVTTIQSAEMTRGRIRLVARLGAKEMSLKVGDTEKLVRKSPGLIPVQPKDPLTFGSDTLSSVGNYESPFPFNGKILSAAVKPIQSSSD